MSRRVLVVEAGSEFSSLVRAGVADIDPGIQVDRADSVNAAVVQLAASGYDLIISDDELDGTRAGLFLRHLCERRFPAIPFVLLASGVEPGEDGGAEPDEAGDEALLRKPFSVGECRERLERLL